MVLDGPVDADAYINDPMRDLSAQSGGFERALGRFFQACAADRDACRGFGGGDPWDAYDQLIEQLDANADPGRRRRPPGRSTATTSLTGTALALYSKGTGRCWPQALADAPQNGDGTLHARRSRTLLRPQRRRDLRPGQRPLLHASARPSSSYPRDVGHYL